jgi:hypothetical protein
VEETVLRALRAEPEAWRALADGMGREEAACLMRGLATLVDRAATLFGYLDWRTPGGSEADHGRSERNAKRVGRAARRALSAVVR